MIKPSTLYTTIVFSAVLLSAYAALAHTAPTGWSYDPSCCSGIDCAPVEDGVIEEQADGIHVKGYGVLSESDPRVHWSKDGQDHICVTQDASHRLLCIYRKPKSF